MAVITCIEDLRRLARWRVPRMFYDYVDCGDIIGAAATQPVDIDGRIEHQRATDRRLASCPDEI
jgi:hypothetical protein